MAVWLQCLAGMNTPLRERFRRALQATTVVAPLALTACGPVVTDYTPVICEGGEVSIKGLTPPVIPDVTVLRSINSFGSADQESSRDVSTDGEACRTATNKPDCQSALAALKPATGFGESCLQICNRYVIATTRGDTVEAVSSLEQLKLFLGTIDTAQEAMLIALAHSYTLDCSDKTMGSVKKIGDSWEVLARKGIACGKGSAITRYYLSIDADGSLTERSSEVVERGADNCAIGRRPEGLISSGASGCEVAVGRFFATVAHLEAASVPAFERLHRELAAVGAPETLQRAALASALEEIDHTRRMGALARKFGAQVTVPEVEEVPLRGLRGLALDNAVEGCVRETYGALVAHYQAMHAQDADVRAALVSIAEDETRHAELSWAIDAWATSQLSEAERVEIESARSAALASLASELEAEVDHSVMQLAGMPPPHVAKALLTSLMN